MLLYAGEAHAAILDALDTYVTDEQWDAIQADTFPTSALRDEMARAAAPRASITAPLGAHFPGWHSALDAGW